MPDEYTPYWWRSVMSPGMLTNPVVNELTPPSGLVPGPGATPPGSGLVPGPGITPSPGSSLSGLGLLQSFVTQYPAVTLGTLGIMVGLLLAKRR